MHVFFGFKTAYIQRIFYFKYSILLHGIWEIASSIRIKEHSASASFVTDSSDMLLIFSCISSVRCSSALEDFSFGGRIMFYVEYPPSRWNAFNWSFVKCHFSAKIQYSKKPLSTFSGGLSCSVSSFMLTIFLVMGNVVKILENLFSARLQEFLHKFIVSV